jgi:hypothetical protein
VSSVLHAVRSLVQPVGLHLNPPVEYQWKNHEGEDGKQRYNKISHAIVLLHEHCNFNVSGFLINFEGFYIDKRPLVSQPSPLMIKVVFVFCSFFFLAGLQFFQLFSCWGVRISVFRPALQKGFFLINLI